MKTTESKFDQYCRCLPVDIDDEPSSSFQGWVLGAGVALVAPLAISIVALILGLAVISAVMTVASELNFTFG